MEFALYDEDIPRLQEHLDMVRGLGKSSKMFMNIFDILEKRPRLVGKLVPSGVAGPSFAALRH